MALDSRRGHGKPAIFRHRFLWHSWTGELCWNSNCGYRSHPGRIIGYINTATYQAQIQAIEQLVPQHSGPLTGAIAYIRVRTTAGPSSPTTQARAMVEKAAQDIFAKLHIHAGVVKLPAGGPRVFPVRCTSVLTQRRCLTMERITR